MPGRRDKATPERGGSRLPGPPPPRPNMAAAPRRSPTCCQPAGAPLAPPPGGVANARPRRVAPRRARRLAAGGAGPAQRAPWRGGSAPGERGQFPASRGGCSGAGGAAFGSRTQPAPCPLPPRTHGAAVRGRRPPRSPRRARPAPPGGPSGAAEPAEPGGTLQPPRVLLQVRAAGDQALHAEDAGLLDAGGTALAAASAPAAAPVWLPGRFLQACAFPLRREGAGGAGKHSQKHPARVRRGWFGAVASCRGAGDNPGDTTAPQSHGSWRAGGQVPGAGGGRGLHVEGPLAGGEGGLQPGRVSGSKM